MHRGRICYAQSYLAISSCMGGGSARRCANVGIGRSCRVRGTLSECRNLSTSAASRWSGTSLQELMELGGWRSYELVLRYAHLAPEILSSVASRIGRQPAVASLKVAPRGKNVAENATFSLRLVNRALPIGSKYLIDWRARRESNSRPPGS